jgi:DNA-binding HxlR family transcriptional regulator
VEENFTKLSRKDEDLARALSDVQLEKEFQAFGEAAMAFVRKASAHGAVPYRGGPSSLKDNVNVTRKVFSKWSVEIILSIYSLESAGFGDLKRLLGGISSQVLSKKLRDLEDMGIIRREVVESRPAKVRYTLSERGVLLAKIGEPVILYLRQTMR